MKKDLWISTGTDRIAHNRLEITFFPTIDPDLKKEIRRCVRWIRKRYVFPEPLRMVFCSDEYVISYLSNDRSVASIFFPKSIYHHPVARIALGDYSSDVADAGAFNAKNDILFSMAKLIDFYFQYRNGFATPSFDKKRAREKAKRIVKSYIAANNEMDCAAKL